MSLLVDIEKNCGDFQLRISFEATKEVLGLLGASGCGKSMTLKCIAGIERPDKGIIRLDDKVFFDSKRHINLPVQKRKVGYLFQDYALFPNMTVLQNIQCGAGNMEKAQEYVRRFYLEGMENLYPMQLSGGQKQRTAMARMLSGEPDILMLDEPFSALDNYLKNQLERELMGRIREFGKTVLFVSHDRNEAYRMTNRIAVMEAGHVVEMQSRNELFEHPKTLAAARLTGCKNFSAIERKEDGSLYASDWGVTLSGNPQGQHHYAGIRAHYFERVSGMEETNVIECRVLRVVEDIFSTSVLCCNTKPISHAQHEGNYEIITWETSGTEEDGLKEGESLYLKIPAEQIIFLE